MKINTIGSIATLWKAQNVNSADNSIGSVNVLTSNIARYIIFKNR